jgi:hypothetical protein
MNRFNTLHLNILLGALLCTIGSVSSAHGQGFGRVGAVNQEATGTPPGSAARKLTVGTNIVVKERVRTSASGSTQIQFPDQSAVNLGANSDLVIDQFVYNPGAKSGTMVASVSRGVLRFIGGNISHNAGAELVFAHFGEITLSNNVSTAILHSGFATVIGSANTPIPTPFRISDATLRLIMRLINSKQNQTGGVANVVKPGQVPNGYKYTVVQDPNEPPGTDPLGYTSIFGTSGKGVSQTTQAGSTTKPPPPPPSCCD